MFARLQRQQLAVSTRRYQEHPEEVMVRTSFARFASLGALDHGLVTRRTLIKEGVAARTIDRWIAEGLLVVVHPGVYRVAGAPRTWEQSVHGAVLAAGPGSAAWHRSAARSWGIGDQHWADVEITVPMPRLPKLQGVIVHRSRDLGPPWTLTKAARG